MERTQGIGGDNGTEKEATLKTPLHLWEEELKQGNSTVPKKWSSGAECVGRTRIQKPLLTD